MLMMRFFLLMMVSGIIAVPAFAQDEESGEPVTEGNAKVEPGAGGEAGSLLEEPAKKIKRKKKKNGDSGKKLAKMSVDNRIGKKVFAAIELAGLTPNVGFGVRGGYFLSPDSILGLSYAAGSFETKTQNYKKSIFEVTFKRFFTNSLYADAGLGYQKWTVDYRVTDNSNSTKELNSQATIADIGLVLHIGNQWQWRAFTVGCDWAGYFQPLSSSKKFADAGDANKADQAKEERAVEHNTRSTFHLLRLFAGYAF